MQQGPHQGTTKASKLPAFLLLATVTAGLALTARNIADVSVTVTMISSEQTLADASQARMTRLAAPTVYDHYGNPAAFVKYIIRRPPTLA
jgi:hypothetical protein